MYNIYKIVGSYFTCARALFVSHVKPFIKIPHCVHCVNITRFFYMDLIVISANPIWIKNGILIMVYYSLHRLDRNLFCNGNVAKAAGLYLKQRLWSRGHEISLIMTITFHHMSWHYNNGTILTHVCPCSIPKQDDAPWLYNENPCCLW